MKKALLIVDYQNDFVAPGGALSVGEAALEIEKPLAGLAEEYDERDIYFSFDDHSETDWETDLFPEPRVFPKHCVRGTKGFALYGKIKGMDNRANHFLKHAYCPKEEDLHKLVTNYDQITVAGVVTDICVFQTVIGLYTAAVNRAKKCRLMVDSTACASFNPERAARALLYLREVLQVEIVSSAQSEPEQESTAQ